MTFLIFAFHHTSKWNLVQLYLDAILIGLLNLVIIWIFFFNKDVNLIKSMLDSDFTSIISIVLDILIAICVLSWLFSIRSGKIAFHDYVIFSGFLIFSFVDQVFLYTALHHVYYPNSLIDFTYTLSLQIMAFGIALQALSKYLSLNPTTVTNIGSTNKWLLLFLYPAGTYLLKDIDMKAQVNIVDILLLIVLILLYRAASKYVQLSIRLLAQEKQMNELLEKRVAEQVSELTYLANRDTLTMLYNRRYFYNSVDGCIKPYIKGIKIYRPLYSKLHSTFLIAL